jgi:DNA-binding response OmpR family regulator
MREFSSGPEMRILSSWSNGSLISACDTACMSDSTSTGGPYRILLIDDDERLLALAQLAMTKHGAETKTATTATDGLALIDAYRPDLVVLDVLLPDLSGWEVLRRIRAGSSVHVMLLSGRDSDVDKARGLDLGADDYLTKPFSFVEFEARVRALLRRARPQ